MNQPSDNTMQDLPAIGAARISWAVERDVLIALMRGCRENPATMRRVWSAIRTLADRHGPVKVLAMDEMDDEPFVGAERDAFLSELLPIGIGVRWAYVARSVDRLARYEATQLDALEAGIDVRVFGSRSDAELWLRFGG